MKTRTIKILSAVTVMLGMVTGVHAQNPPEKVSIDSKDHYLHGFNGSGTNTFNPDGTPVIKDQEVRDSVTVTSVFKYFVLPDKNINSNWYNSNGTIKDITNTSNLNSDFEWAIDATSLGATNSSTTPIVQVTWGNTPGTGVLKAKEKPKSQVACEGGFTEIPVAVIAKPTFKFDNSTHTLYKDSACHVGVSSSNKASYNFPIITTSSSSQLQVDYTVTKDGSSLTNGTNVSVVNGTGTLTLEFDAYGVYEITITKITDRVSRKPTTHVVGDILSGANKFVYRVMPPVQTGPIYRLPNAGNY